MDEKKFAEALTELLLCPVSTPLPWILLFLGIEDCEGNEKATAPVQLSLVKTKRVLEESWSYDQIEHSATEYLIFRNRILKKRCMT